MDSSVIVNKFISTHDACSLVVVFYFPSGCTYCKASVFKQNVEGLREILSLQPWCFGGVEPQILSSFFLSVLNLTFFFFNFYFIFIF